MVFRNLNPFKPFKRAQLRDDSHSIILPRDDANTRLAKIAYRTTPPDVLLDPVVARTLGLDLDGNATESERI